MAKYLGNALNKTSSMTELVTQPGFNWKNRGSMVFIGDKNVRIRSPFQVTRLTDRQWLMLPKRVDSELDSLGMSFV